MTVGLICGLISETPMLLISALVLTGLAMFIALAFSFVSWLFKPRNFQRALFVFACLGTRGALFYAEEDWRGWHALNQFEKEWSAKGERFDKASVIPPPVPDDQNFALTPIWVESMKAQLGPKNARSWFGDQYAENGRTNFVYRLNMDLYRHDVRSSDEANPKLGNWQKAELTDLAAWQKYYRAPAEVASGKMATNEFPVAPQPQTPAADVLLALSKYDAVIAELRQAAKLPEARFPIEYDKELPATILLPHLAGLKSCATELGLRAVAELQNNQSDAALADVKLILRLSDAPRQEPFLISHLVLVAITEIAIQSIYEGLATHRWSDAQLTELDAALARLDLLAGYRTAMRGELVLCEIGDTEYLRRHPGEIQNIGFYDGDRGVQAPSSSFGQAIAYLIPSGWFYQNEFRCVRMITEYLIPVVDVNHQVISPAAMREANRVLQSETKTLTPYNLLERMLVPGISSAVKRFAWAQASVDLARTAIALERYRLARGEFPESLDALLPQFVAQVPHDVIGGQPLHYRRTSDGRFVLYSVGWNETDDGGVVVFKQGSTPSVDLDKGDWVWR